MSRNKIPLWVVGITLFASPWLEAQTKGGEDGWTFELIPYLWASGLDGTVQVGEREAEIGITFADLLSDAQFGFSAALDARKGRFRLVLDGLFASISQDTTIPFPEALPLPNGPSEVEQTSSSKFLIFDGVGGYELARSLYVIGGLRYTRFNQSITFATRSAIEVEGTVNLVDGIVGVVSADRIGDSKWRYLFRADVGAGSSDLTWLLSFGGGYQFSDRFGLLGGARFAKLDFVEGPLDVDLTMSGLAIALGITF